MHSPRSLLRLEGLAVAIAGLVAYHGLGASWLKFAVLILAPDLAMLGYLMGKSAGAAFYNVAHTYATVGFVWLIGYEAHGSWISAVCLIWVVHIGFDRALGFGLKYPVSFKDTHLQRV